MGAWAFFVDQQTGAAVSGHCPKAESDAWLHQAYYSDGDESVQARNWLPRPLLAQTLPPVMRSSRTPFRFPP